MFLVDSKKQIDNFEKQISEQEKTITSQKKEIDELKFQINNPPKFKTGDKIGDLIVTKRNYNDGDFLSIFTDHSFATDFMLTVIFGGRLTSDSKKLASNKSVRGYVYELTNVKTGETLTKKESDLIS